MNKIFIFFIVYCCLSVAPFLALGQNDIYNFKYEVEDVINQTYGSPLEFQASHIVSDYGKRNVGATMSRWHRGVDFSIGSPVTQWDHFLSLNNCEIKKLKGGYGYKYLITEGTEIGEMHNFGYGHLFNKETPNPEIIKGDLVLKEMDSPNQDYYAIIVLPFPYLTAFGPRTGTVTYEGIEVPVTNEIDQYDILGNIGRSFPSYNASYQHVHVYMFNDINLALSNVGNGGHNNIYNDRDPLSVISHYNTTYKVSIENDENVTDKIVVSSGSNAISIKTRYIMEGENNPPVGKFNTVVMDVDNIDLFIKKHNTNIEIDDAKWGTECSNYKLIKGEFVDSHLSHGARTESEIYPIKANTTYGYNENPRYNTQIDLVGQTFGSFSSTGIYPALSVVCNYAFI